MVDIVYLVSGEDDLSEAVDGAQSHGVQVVLMAVPDRVGRAHAVSKHLIREADDLIVLDGSIIDDTVHVRQLQVEEPAPLSEAAAAVTVPLPGPRQPAAGDNAVSVGAAIPSASRSAPTVTPSVLAGHRPVAKSGVASAPAEATESKPVWSSASSGVAARQTASTTAAELELIDEVCRGVISAWSLTASADDRRRLLAKNPFIPGDLDRALLIDLSDRLGVYDVDDHLRYLLRDHFWTALETVSL